MVERWSQNSPVNEIFKRLHSFIGINDPLHSFHTAYVASKSNPADGPSRGIYPLETSSSHLLTYQPNLTSSSCDSEQPLTPTEQRLLREGRYPQQQQNSLLMLTGGLRQAFSSTSALSMTSSISTNHSWDE